MAGTKHPHSDDEMENPTSSPFMSIFEHFRDELDEHQARRERIIKASRDITALSKKMIFSLQRVRHLAAPLPPKVSQENAPRTQQISDLFLSIVPDLQGMNAWRYARNITSGIQECMEAVSFQHYLETQALITHKEAQDKLPEGVQLGEEDYVLGLFDMVGEVMRFAITTMATNGELPKGKAAGGSEGGRDVLTDLRALRTCFESLDIVGGGGEGLKRDVEKKMEVMRTCVEKVEGAVYGMIIRGRERPKGWVPDLGGEGAREVETY